MPKTISKLIKSKVRKRKADTALKRNLLRRIGSPTVVGRKNYDFYGQKIGKLIKEQKQEKAVAFAKKERARVIRGESGGLRKKK